jgi:O-succinylbenzoic acid--CoA ligase
MDHWLVRAAAMHPERYGEMRSAAESAAGALAECGVGPGDRVGLALPPGPAFVAALHGCWFAGAVAVPIDLRLTVEERAARSAGTVLVVEEDLSGTPLQAPRPVSLDDVATVMHTSGTTSAPKRVELTYGNWLANASGSAIALALDPAERWLCPMPLAHVGGLSILIRSTIYATTVVLHERFDTGAVLAELSDPTRAITLTSLVPTMLGRLLDAGLERPPTLRWALLGGGPIPAPLLERAAAAGVPVAPTYGMTEACSQIATFGLPLQGVELRLDGPDGEILVRGPSVAPGALGDDGWLHTGDLGAFDERGRLAITGRKADTIVSGGENVAPAEVESVLLEHSSVGDAGVFARPDPEWGEAVIAVIVPRDGESVDPIALKAHCAARLAPFKIPKAFEQRAELPRTPSGKLLRRKLI